jgi:hypothetical protein
MYCPNCGKTNSADQKFCRSCGLGLERIAQSVAEQLPREGLDKQLQDRTRVVDRWLNIVGGTAVSILVVGVLWGIIYKIIIVKGDVLEGSIFLAFVIAIILFASLAYYQNAVLKSGATQQRGRTGSFPSQNTAELIPESSAPLISSVTENTTELLLTEKDNIQSKDLDRVAGVLSPDESRDPKQ